MRKNNTYLLLLLLFLFLWWRKKTMKNNLSNMVKKCANSKCGGFDPNSQLGCPDGCKCPDAPADLPDASRNCIPA